MRGRLCTDRWNYDARADGSGLGWDRSFLSSVGFGEGELGPSVLGADVRAPGEPIGGGLGAAAAAELGLSPGVPLAVGMIDAHAGGLGCLGAAIPGHAANAQPPLAARLGLIAGTSTCHMASSAQPTFVRGVWGPYYAAMVPSLYLNEGGQSAAGALLDFQLEHHAASAELQSAASAAGMPPALVLNARLAELAAAAGLPHVAALAADLHVTPDYLGNRSPLADPTMRGGVVGLGLSASLDDLAILYLATVQVRAALRCCCAGGLGAARWRPLPPLYTLRRNELTP